MASVRFSRASLRAVLGTLALATLQACGGGGGGGGTTPPTVNRAPTIAATSPRTVAEGGTLTIEIIATDPDGDTLTYDPGSYPAFVTLVATTPGRAELRVNPDFNHSGTYSLTVVVRDTAGNSDTEIVALTVTDAPGAPNTAPVIAAIPAQTMPEGETRNVPVSATDAEGHAIALTATGLPAFATFTDNGSGSGTLSFTPTLTDKGAYTITLRAADNGTPSASSTRTVSLTVLDFTDNQVALENQLTGTNAWRLTNPAEARQIEGYASATSVDRGESIALHVRTPSPTTFQFEVFRMGWYQGLGARRVFGPAQASAAPHAVPTPSASSSNFGLVDANWPVAYDLDTETAGSPWRTGVYLVKLTSDANGKQSYILFVVRDDAHTPDVLFSLPVTTYQAYNPWGGRSLYPTQSGNAEPWGIEPGAGGNTRAVKVSFNRPYAAPVAPSALYGVGAGEFLTNTQPLSPNPNNYPISGAGWDYNMVRWLEYEQYDVGYVTNVDIHRSSSHFDGVRTFLSPGHDEYWSWSMFDRTEQARNAGVNLAFFSANTAYRQIRFESSANSAGSPEQSQRIIVHYREVPDPNPTGDPRLVTTEFRDSPNPGRPEQGLIGVQYDEERPGNPVDGNIVVTNATHPVFAGTGLSNGSVLNGLLGYEVDRRYNGFGTVVELASSPYSLVGQPGVTGTSHMSIYPSGTGAEVFATGSIQWSWGLDDFNSPLLRTSRLSAAAQRITSNVLARFGAQPYMPDPINAHCVQLRAVSNANGNASWASAAEIYLVGPDGNEVSRAQWSVTADSEDLVAGNPAINAIDGNVNTFWHSAYSGGATPPLPHTLTIDLGSAPVAVSALRYLPRQDGTLNGIIANYAVLASPTPCSAPTWTTVASGNWLEGLSTNSGRKIARFTP